MFAVGDSTAARARGAGFTCVGSASGDAVGLAALVNSTLPKGATLLLVTGQGLGDALASRLRGCGFAVMRRCVYAQTRVSRIPRPAISALRSGRVSAAMFFSAETATHFAAMLSRGGLYDTISNVDAVTISNRAAMALEGLPWRRVLVAARPNQDAMLALLHDQ